MTQVLVVNLFVVAGLMILLWVLSVARRDASIVDPFWGMGFVVVAWLTYVQLPAPGPRPLLLAALTTVWGLRLSAYLLWRNWGHGEDRRYAAMRQHHGQRFWFVSLGTVFLLQAGLLWFVALPLQVGEYLGGQNS